MSTLDGKTIIMSGGSRGIGEAIALRAAKDGANIALLAKTAEPHPKLPGTIYTAAEAIEKAGGHALPILGDVRDDDGVAAAVAKTVEQFGGIDIVVNNASAIDLTPTEQVSMKRYDLMQDINARGTFLLSKLAIPHLRRSANPHILTLSPPISLDEKWFTAGHLAYSIAKYSMSLVTVGLAAELRQDGVAVNSLWPRTTIDTAAIRNVVGAELADRSRTPEIMADAAYAILTKPSRRGHRELLPRRRGAARRGRHRLREVPHRRCGGGPPARLLGRPGLTGVREPQQERSRTTRRRLIEAALDSFGERGWHGVTVAGIAERAGVSRGAAQHHFPTREDLVVAAVDLLGQSQIDELRAQAADLPSGASRIERVVEMVLNLYTGPAVPRGPAAVVDRGDRRVAAGRARAAGSAGRARGAPGGGGAARRRRVPPGRARTGPGHSRPRPRAGPGEPAHGRRAPAQADRAGVGTDAGAAARVSGSSAAWLRSSAARWITSS